MNSVNLIGRLAQDIELKYTSNNNANARFSLAVARKYKNSDGEYVTDFLPCEAWRKTAEVMAERLKKGDQVGIEGCLNQDRYEKDGKKVSFVKVIVNSFTFIGGKKENREEQEQRPEHQNTEKSAPEVNDNDLPF
jgi:single-strand DNA-binding protein